MKVSVLGEIAAGRDGRVRPVNGPIQRRVFATLVARRDETVPISTLVDACWSDGQLPARAEHNLRSYVHRVRRAIDDDGDLIETTPHGYRLCVTKEDVDADEFAALARSATRALTVGDAVTAIDAAERALGLWHGPPYAEFSDQPWAAPEAVHLAELHVGVRLDHAEALLEIGKPDTAVNELERLVLEEPLRERPRALLMRALYDTGRQVEALRQFQDYRRLLIDEAGVEPSPELVELDRRLATGVSSTAPRVVGNYELRERIGVGAFAIVHRATQRNLGRDVAIKVVRAELADDPAFIRRFEAEAQMVASIEHPNVVPLYDYWREPGQAFLVMRWMTGGSLETRLDDGPWSIERTAELVEQIAAALDAAHAREVVHRDVKPANILFDDDGRAYLGDFGIALAADERATPAAALSEGSPVFAAPEQLSREPVGPEADVHALAIVAFTLLTGRTPFADAPDESSVLHHQLHDPIPSVGRFRPGLPAAIDTVLATATAKRATDRHPSAGAFARAFRAAALGHERHVAPRDVHAGNPYVGLQAFDEADAAVFHGRRRLVHELLGRLRDPDQRLLVIVGPSGAGKSSAVRAGLLPAIRSGALTGSELWFTTSMIPGQRPYAALETALLRVAVDPPATLGELLRDGDRGIVRACKRILPDDGGTIALVVDQFEELFTSSAREERDDFLRALAVAVEAPGSPLRVIATLRADFFDAPLRHPVLAPLVKRSSVAITPLAADELEEAITRPANDVGMQFEPGLVAEIVADVNSQPGALPLLQYALMRLFDAADDSVITIADYRRIGGIAEALAHRAEALYHDADEDDRTAVRQLFERLVHVTEGPDDTRRRIRRSELPTDAATERVLERFAAARLLTFDRDPSTREPTVEIAHEALIRAWPRLQEWLEDDRELLRVHRQLTVAATGWAERGREASELYRGARLEQAERLLVDDRIALNEDEREFLGASCEAREADARRERARLRRLRRLTTASAAAAVVALVAGAAAAVQWRRADRQAGRAEVAAAEVVTRATESTAQRLTEQSLGAMEEDPDLAILLALESVHRTNAAGQPPVPGAIEALHTVTQSSRVLARFPSDGVSALHPDGARVALTRSGNETDEVVILDAVTGAVVHQAPIEGNAQSLAFVEDGRRLVVVTDRTITLWDAEEMTAIHTAPAPCCTHHIEIGDHFIATGLGVEEGADRTVVWDLSDLALVSDVEGDPVGWIEDDLVVVGDDDVVQRIDVANGVADTVEMPDDVLSAHDVSPDGTRLLVRTDTGALAVAALDGDRAGELVEVGIDLGVVFQWAGFTADGRHVFAAGPNHEIRLVPADVGTGDGGLSLRGNPSVWDVSTDATGDRLLASGPGETLLWDLTPGGPDDLGAIPVEGEVWWAEFSADASTMYLADQPDGSGRMRAIDIESGADMAGQDGFGALVRWNRSPFATRDGIVAGWVGDGRPGRVVELFTGRELGQLDPCDVPNALDGDGRWLVVTRVGGPGCAGPETSRILDPVTGEVLHTLPTPAGYADIGPPGTIADGVLVYQRLPGPGHVFYDLRTGTELGSVEIFAWTPTFSADGRFVGIGSGDDGAFALDVERVLAGDADDAIALNPLPDAGASFSVVVDDRLITGHGGDVLRFWRLSDGVQELALPVDSGDSTYIFATPDGRYLYYESDGHLLRRFPLHLDDLVELAERRVQRWFRTEECERFGLSDDCDRFAGFGRRGDAAATELRCGACRVETCVGGDGSQALDERTNRCARLTIRLPPGAPGRGVVEPSRAASPSRRSPRRRSRRPATEVAASVTSPGYGPPRRRSTGSRSPRTPATSWATSPRSC